MDIHSITPKQVLDRRRRHRTKRIIPWEGVAVVEVLAGLIMSLLPGAYILWLLL